MSTAATAFERTVFKMATKVAFALHEDVFSIVDAVADYLRVNPGATAIEVTVQVRRVVTGN